MLTGPGGASKYIPVYVEYSRVAYSRVELFSYPDLPLLALRFLVERCRVLYSRSKQGIYNNNHYVGPICGDSRAEYLPIDTLLYFTLPHFTYK